MAKPLLNKVVWLTGASSGIGEALTYILAARGAKLILSARRKEELERVKGNCPVATQADIRILPLDLAAAETLELSAHAAIQVFGFVDILINNGGIGQGSLAKNTSLADDRRIMEVDYFGTVALSKYMIPHFIERSSGHFVVISSVLGKFGTPMRSGYAAAKHALHGFFDSLRAELWRDSRNIFVTMICPGWVRTNLGEHAVRGNQNPEKISSGKIDQGLAADACARQIVRAIELRKREVIIAGTTERNAVRMSQYLPSLFSRIVRKANVKRK